MPCHWIKLEDGTLVHINMGRRKPARCEFCKKRPHTKLCDHRLGGLGTCDAKMCDMCATHTDPDTDRCPKHSRFPMLSGDTVAP